MQRFAIRPREAIAAHSRLGLNVVVDVGHHDAYSVPQGILPSCARQLQGLPAWFVGVRCPLEVVMERRRATWHVGDADGGPVPQAVRFGPPPSAFRRLAAMATG